MAIDYKRFMFLALVTITLFAFANHAFALGVQTGPGLPGEQALDSLRKFILGPVAFTLVLFAILVLGWALIRGGGGQMSDTLSVAVWTIVGAGVVLGAMQLVMLFFPGATIPPELIDALAA